jgi:hypothetical protein
MSALSLIFILLIILCPAGSESAYRVFLKNGQVMDDVDNVTGEAEKVRLHKYGVVIELQRSSIEKIEEYEGAGTAEGEEGVNGSTEGGEPSGYPVNQENTPEDRKKWKGEADLEFRQLISQNEVLYRQAKETLESRSKELEQDIKQKIERGYPTDAEERREQKNVVDKKLKSLLKEKTYSLLVKQQDMDIGSIRPSRLKKQNLSFLDLIIGVFQDRSRETEGRIHRAVRMGLPRKARKYRQEKALIDEKIENFKEEKALLLNEEKRSGGKPLYDKDGNHKKGSEEKYFDTRAEGGKEATGYELREVAPGVYRTDKPALEVQLEDLKRREQAGTLPEQFKPYKDFLEKQQIK